MCNVFLSISDNQLDPVDYEEILRMFHHRGPDASGNIMERVDGKYVNFFHNRLSIQDVSEHSDQPFRYKNYIIIFNGEIYNFLNLKIKYNLNCSTGSDTEVIVRLFDKYGPDIVHEFDGPFAFVIMDTSEKKIFCFRDVLGEKPLFYSLQSEFVVGSTEKQVIKYHQLLGVSHLASKDAITDVHLHQFSNSSLFEGIHKVVPGSYIAYDIVAKTVQSKKFKAFTYNDQVPFDFKVFVELFQESLARRLISDRKVGLLFSGGLDSSFVAANIKKENRDKINLLTVTDDYEDSTETERSRQIASLLEFKHQVIESSINQLPYYFDLLNQSDNFNADPAAISLLDLYRNSTAIVYLTGDGADECYLSYSNYREIIDANHKRNSKLWTNVLRIFPAGRIKNKLVQLAMISPAEKISHYIGYESQTSKSFREACKKSTVNKVRDLYLYSLEYELPNYLLAKADNCSMFYGKEARSPFLSYDLMQYCISSDAYLYLSDKRLIQNHINNKLGSRFEIEKKGMSTTITELLYGKKSKINNIKKFTKDCLNRWMEGANDFLLK
ncbi:asparagine synthase-related protein [Gammaproteobacteria bacterium]|nr:asparagine synthase-related protein [Gammaproteobacteria bacterium]